MTNQHPVTLDLTTFNELVDILTPFMLDEADRRALLLLVLPSPAHPRIRFGGPADTFTSQLLSDLLHYGEVAPGQPALIALLDVLLNRVGPDRQAELKAQRQKLISVLKPGQPSTLLCPACGASNRRNASFCRVCGHRLSSRQSSSRPSQWLWLARMALAQKNLIITLPVIMLVVVILWPGMSKRFLPSLLPPPAQTPVKLTVSAAVTTGAATPTNPLATALPYPLDKLAGIWQVSRQNQFGSSLVDWEIQVNNKLMTIEEFHQNVSGVPLPGDYRYTLQLTDRTFDGHQLAFTATGSVQGVTEKFDLIVVTADRMEGTYTAKETTLSDTGIIQGKAGIITTTGKAILIRKE